MIKIASEQLPGSGIFGYDALLAFFANINLIQI
jgi:hypothetical protein